jgi:hypothetical protein
MKANKKYFVTIILIGLLIRLLLMPFFMHVDYRMGGDLIAANRAAALFIQNPNQIKSPYPPLALYILGGFQSIWNGFSQNPFIVPLDERINLLFSPNIFRMLFFSKLLYLLFDIFTMGIIYWFFAEEPEKQRRALTFWIFNPLVLWSGYIHGQYDLLPVFFIVLMFLLIKKDRLVLAMVSLALAASLKNFPFLFLIPFILIVTHNWWKRILLFSVGIIPFFLFLIPVSATYLKNSGDFFTPFFAVGYSVGDGQFIYLFFVFYALICWLLFRMKGRTFTDIWASGLIILLIYFLFSPNDLHYWVWIVPFALFFWVENPQKAKAPFFVIMSCLLILLIPVPFLRFASPVSPGILLHVPSLLEIFNQYLPMTVIINIVHSILLGTNLFVIGIILKDQYLVNPSQLSSSSLSPRL